MELLHVARTTIERNSIWSTRSDKHRANIALSALGPRSIRGPIDVTKASVSLLERGEDTTNKRENSWFGLVDETIILVNVNFLGFYTWKIRNITILV